MLANNKRVFPTTGETKEEAKQQQGTQDEEDMEEVVREAAEEEENTFLSPLQSELRSKRSVSRPLSIEPQQQTTRDAANYSGVDPYDSPFTIKEAFTFFIPDEFLPFVLDEVKAVYQESFTSKYV